MASAWSASLYRPNEVWGWSQAPSGSRDKALSGGSGPSGGRSAPEAESFLYTFIQKGPKVKDLNETIQSKICTFYVLRNWPIVQSEVDVGPNDSKISHRLNGVATLPWKYIDVRKTNNNSQQACWQTKDILTKITVNDLYDATVLDPSLDTWRVE